MRIFVPKEIKSDESRVPVTAEAAGRLIKLGAQVETESGLGSSIGVEDAQYTGVGAIVIQDRRQSLSSADLVLRLNPPPIEEVRLMRPGAIHVGFLDPFNNLDTVRELAAAGVSAVCMELIPRSTIAQKMDALSSQASLAGYVAVIVAADRLNRIFPMMMTPAGTISPARVFVIGAGVAGLQAIATAKRMGARVEAFDVRPEVEEQVKSLGAKFVRIALGETGRTEQGYAKQLTEEQLQRQREAMAKQCALSDVVITTAQVFGKRAPLIVTTEMVRGMKPGSVVVDLAVESGGNVECSELNREVVVNGVKVVGYGDLARRVPVHASQMYANNLAAFVEHFWDKENRRLALNPADDILQSALVTHDNRVCNEVIQNLMR
ncbi:MAG TPA: NAD(P) transhydrogenase subunit alpha [Blastocatellia bacterium]|nr:NAD(P) transhydrogenase subunit alpha [Blastocatellia bacterium]